MTRIVAGTVGGRTLQVPSRGTRPTSERVREALFSRLEHLGVVDGARVLDLYAGTGAVGLEALSRGAAVAVLVEKSRAAIDVLRRNVATIGLPGAEIVPMAVSRYLAGAPEHPFDVVFADPPYGTELTGTLARLSDPRWLAPSAVVIVEQSARDTPIDEAAAFLTPVGERRYGDTVLWYGRRR